MSSSFSASYASDFKEAASFVLPLLDTEISMSSGWFSTACASDFTYTIGFLLHLLYGENRFLSSIFLELWHDASNLQSVRRSRCPWMP